MQCLKFRGMKWTHRNTPSLKIRRVQYGVINTLHLKRVTNGHQWQPMVLLFMLLGHVPKVVKVVFEL